MPSPFPGMDPFIESQRNWSDSHHGLACEIRASLNGTIQPDYYATTVTYVVYDKLETPLRLANVEVREAESDELVTAIEILSPINKRKGRERQKYLRKRRELLRSEVHLIEIDFLRGGERSPLEVEPPKASYYVMLGRADHRPTIDIWPIQISERLPVIPVPLYAPDPDVPLDLGAIVRSVYERGAFTTRLDYTQPVPPPAFKGEEQIWIEELLSIYPPSIK